jgi:hypothetical protein
MTEAEPTQIVFTNHDLLTDIMPFANGGYYNYDRLLYKAGQTTPTGLAVLTTTDAGSCHYYDLQGRRLTRKPAARGIYIKDGKKVIVE